MPCSAARFLGLACAHASVLDHVDPFIGSGGLGFGAGSLNPGAQMPFGSMRLGPDTAQAVSLRDIVLGFDHCGGYSHADEHLRAFSHVHLVGAGVVDYGNFGLLPARIAGGETGLQQLVAGTRRAVAMDKGSERASPGWYSVKLEGSTHASANVTVTGGHSGMHMYHFDTGYDGACAVVFDACHTASAKSEECRNATLAVEVGKDGTATVKSSIVMHGSLTGRAHNSEDGVALHFIGKLALNGEPRLWASGEVQDAGAHEAAASGSLGAILPVDCDAATFIRVAISHVSSESAQRNLATDVGMTFNDAASSVAGEWDKLLSKVTATSTNVDLKRKFYTGLYHSFMAPTRISESQGEYLGMDGSIQTVASRPDDERDYHYSDMSLWDVHRTQLPLLSLLQPRVFEDVISSLADMARTGGDVPRWPLANVYTGCMIGSHVMANIAEAQLKGHTRIDFDSLHQHGWQTVTEERPHAGRSHLQDYIDFGYVPSDDSDTAASLTLSYAFDDWSVATMCDLQGETDRAEMLRNRSRIAYQSLFNPRRELMCPKTRQGKFQCPVLEALPYPFETDFTEGSALDWLWFVPQDPAGLVDLFPSKEAFVKRLDSFMADSRPKADGGKWPFGTILANGWYWAGNEPDLLAPWLFNFAGAQHLTAKWTSWLVEHAYGTGADGLPGNDDFGTLSAWLVWACFGLYPLAGTERFVLGVPQFEALTVETPRFRLTVTRHGNGTTVERAELNGTPLADPFLVSFGDLAAAEEASLEVWTRDEVVV